MKNKIKYLLTALAMSFVAIVQTAAAAGAGAASWWDWYQPETPKSLQK